MSPKSKTDDGMTVIDGPREKPSTEVTGRLKAQHDRQRDEYADLPVEVMSPSTTPDNELDNLNFTEVVQKLSEETDLTTASGSAKELLLGVPFIITGMSFHLDDRGNKYIFVQCVTHESRRVNFTDGSSGVMAQLVDHWRKNNRQTRGIMCPRGLRKSEYTVEVDGSPKPAVTYYLA